MKIRLCIDLSWCSLKSTGVDHYSYRLVDALHDIALDKLELHLLLNKYSLEKYREYEEIKKHFIPGPRQLRHFYLQPFMKHIVNNIAVDIIHFPFYSYLGKGKSKKIVTIFDMYHMYHPEHNPNLKAYFYWNKLFIKTSNDSDLIIAISENTKKDILKFFPEINEDKIKTIYLYVEDFYKPVDSKKYLYKLDEKYGIRNEFILFVGVDVKRKNIIGLLKGYKSALVKGFSKDLVLIGRYNKEKIIQQANMIEIPSEKIHILSYVSQNDLVLLQGCAKYCIVPSLYEGFSYPVLQSICCHVPVIVSNNSCLKEVAGEAGIYIENPCDYISIKNALMVSENKESYPKLVGNCQKQKILFSKSYHVSKYINALMELMGKN